MILAAYNLVHGGISTAADEAKYASFPPGRCEVTVLSNGATAIVDHAYNCNSLRNILEITRKRCTGKIITVIDVAGDGLTDAEVIGKLCNSQSNQTYCTCDNPLGGPGTLFEAVVKNAGPASYNVEPDRERAIAKGRNQ